MANLKQSDIGKQLKDLEFMIEKTPEIVKKLDTEFWMFQGMKDLYDMCQDYQQLEFPDMTGQDYVYAKKVVRLLVFVDAFDIKQEKVDTCYFSGVWAALEGVFISPEKMTSYFNKKLNARRGYIEPVKDLGFPDDIAWGTVRTLGNGYGYALKKVGIVPDSIDTASQWEFLEL